MPGGAFNAQVAQFGPFGILSIDSSLARSYGKRRYYATWGGIRHPHAADGQLPPDLIGGPITEERARSVLARALTLIARNDVTSLPARVGSLRVGPARALPLERDRDDVRGRGVVAERGCADDVRLPRSATPYSAIARSSTHA